MFGPIATLYFYPTLFMIRFKNKTKKLERGLCNKMKVKKKKLEKENKCRKVLSFFFLIKIVLFYSTS